MNNSITLWVQSGNLDNPDILSLCGERILPGDRRWVVLSASLFSQHGVTKVISSDELSIQRVGKSYLVKGTLAQVDSLNRARVFSASIQSHMNDIPEILSSELNLYELSLSENCKSELLRFFQRMRRIKCVILGALLLLLVIVFVIVFL